LPRTIACLLGVAALLGSPSLVAQELKIYVEDPGAYRVTFEEMVEAGLGPEPLPSSGIGLESFGKPVPVWVEDGGDGLLGPGDRIEFVGQELRGEYSYLDEYSRFNCYRLRFDHQTPARFRVLDGAPQPAAADDLELEVSRHFEHDLLMLRYRQDKGQPEECWYWAKLTHLDQQPFKVQLELADLDRQSQGMVNLRVGLRAWSEPRTKGKIPEHRVEVLVDGQLVGSDQWDGLDHHPLDFVLPVAALLRGTNTVALRVPRRLLPDSDENIIDVVMLNWIEIRYPSRPTVGDAQVRFSVGEASEGQAVRLAATTDRPVKVYGATGQGLVTAGPEQGFIRFDPPAGEPELYVATAEALLVADELVLDQPSRLEAENLQADYIMITHRSLAEAIEPLAEFHRSRGLTVTVVDVQDIYDEFNHGVLHPRAIRDFISHAFHHWQRPAPRFVLLVGDASWDFKNPTVDDASYADWTYRPGEMRSFVKNTSTPYADHPGVNDRNLVPTWGFPTMEGHAAADTWFACVDGEDDKPDLAIGRLPVVEPGDVTAIVRKTIAYASQPEVGPWRRNLLFITNESKGFQLRSDAVAESFLERGYVPVKIYPSSEELVNEQHTRRIVESLDKGVNMIHFIGHGGRYIWRTGPPDLKKNHDLFGLDHLDQLAQTRRLSMVLSLTCYSAPFDHPGADSIGEKFLRVADKGAIGVVAASWRNSPSPTMGQLLMEEMVKPGATIGEAVMRAKQQLSSVALIQTYNLLGDPAVPVGVPSSDLELEVERVDDRLIVRGRSRADGSLVQALFEVVDSALVTAGRLRLEVNPGGFEVELPVPTLEEGVELRGVRACLWDPAAAWDAVGWYGLASPADEKPQAPTATAGPAGPSPASVRPLDRNDESEPEEERER